LNYRKSLKNLPFEIRKILGMEWVSLEYKTIGIVGEMTRVMI
jgi:hypothetical protein